MTTTPFSITSRRAFIVSNFAFVMTRSAGWAASAVGTSTRLMRRGRMHRPAVDLARPGNRRAPLEKENVISKSRLAMKKVPLDIKIHIAREEHRNDTGARRHGPEQAALTGGDCERGHDDGELSGEHAIKETLTAFGVAIGGKVTLANLEFVQVSDHLVE